MDHAARIEAQLRMGDSEDEDDQDADEPEGDGDMHARPTDGDSETVQACRRVIARRLRRTTSAGFSQ